MSDSSQKSIKVEAAPCRFLSAKMALLPSTLFVFYRTAAGMNDFREHPSQSRAADMSLQLR
jgi:hypothetical protein